MWQFSDELKKRKLKLVSEGYDAYCLFTLEGLEVKLANELNKEYDYLIASPLMKMAHRSNNGEKYDVEEVLLGGYIFLYLPTFKDPYHIKSNYYSYKILSRKNDDGKLTLGDLEYAKWVLDVEGMLSVSEAIKIDGKVKIIKGALKKLEGNIVEYSKKNRNCCVEIDFLGQKTRTWLPFEWVDFDCDEINTKR